MPYEPKPGDVICYDFLWKEEEQKGRDQGAKDRPCAIVVTTNVESDGDTKVLVVPITHSPPTSEGERDSIEIPTKVAKHLGLDTDSSWIRTHQVNVFTWPKNQIPFGVIPINGEYTYGSLPDALNEKINEKINKLQETTSIAIVDRD